MGDKLLFNNGYNSDAYEPTDSEDNYSEEEKELLEKVRQRRGKQQNTKEILAFDESDNTDDDKEDGDDVDELIRDSDIEGAEDDDDLPDSRDWGSKARNFYNTDFVDPDYSTYTEKEEAMAKAEEEEAKVIQLRLAKQMSEKDFQLDKALINAIATEDDEQLQSAQAKRTKVKADFAGLTKRERLRLFQKESPEFAGLIADFEKNLEESKSLLLPVLQYVKEHNVPSIPALEFAQLYQNIALTYCNNIAYYLLLKAKRQPVKSHPNTKRLLQMKQLLLQLTDKYENIIRPQLEALLERIVDGDEFEVLAMQPTAVVKRKTKLGILDEYATKAEPSNKKTKMSSSDNDIDDVGDEHGSVDEDGAEIEDETAIDAELDDEDARRGITYQISKNKGLMPHRKKEQRNPRVKHRAKFRKALIRRKGAVRTVRKETKRYGGEISGIKASVSKSIKFRT